MKSKIVFALALLLIIVPVTSRAQMYGPPPGMPAGGPPAGYEGMQGPPSQEQIDAMMRQAQQQAESQVQSGQVQPGQAPFNPQNPGFTMKPGADGKLVCEYPSTPSDEIKQQCEAALPQAQANFDKMKASGGGAMPGYNGQMPAGAGFPGGPQMMGPGGQGAPSEEEINEKRLAMIRKNIGMLEKEAKRIKAFVDKYKLKGTAIPSTLTASIKELDDAINIIKTSSDADLVTDTIGNIGDVIGRIQDEAKLLPQMAAWPKIKAQALKNIKNLETLHKKYKTKADTKKIDIAEELAQLQTQIDKAKKDWATLEELFKTDPEEALSNGVSDYFDFIQTVNEETIRPMEFVLNFQASLKQMKKMVRDSKSMVSRSKNLDKAEKAALTKIVTEAEAIVAKIEANYKKKDIDATMDSVDELNAKWDEFNESWTDGTGQELPNPYEPVMPKTDPKNPVPQLNLPQGF